MSKSTKILSDITVFSKYAKFDKKKKRRETWEEICYRNMAMQLTKYPQLYQEILNVYNNFVIPKKVLPSMRSMQFGGRSIELSPNRIFNCAYMPVDHYKAFSEAMFLLLGGSGVGYSVQSHHVAALPEIKKPLKKRRFLVEDSIVGWADAVKALFESYMKGKSFPNFDFSDIRPKGAELITSGGKAPGSEPLKKCLFELQLILDRKQDGEKLTTLEAHDMMCFIADAVLSGGIRRAALIALFDVDDQSMLTCKFSSWWEANPQRGRANNSAMVIRHKITEDKFQELWGKIQASGSGEPGIYFSNNTEWGTNPCCFTGDSLVATADGRNAVSFKDLCDENYRGPVYSMQAQTGQVVTSYCSNVWVSKKNAELVKVTLDDDSSFRCTPDHRIMLRSGQYVQAQDLIPGTSLMPFNSFKRAERNYRMISSNSGRDIAQYAHVAQAYDIIKEGYDKQHIHHIDGNGLNDLPSNLEAINASEHNREHMLGENNAVHHIKDVEAWKEKQSALQTGTNNMKFNGVSSEEMSKRITTKTLELGRKLKVREALVLCELSYMGEYRLKELGATSLNDYCQKVFERINHKVVSVERLTEREDVYDMTVEGTHNFAVITSKQDDQFVTSSGVFVHNCEIALRNNQFCNLSEINASDIVDQADLEARAKAAAFLGTLQAGYTDFHYLRDVWRKNTEKDALIGVGMTGIASGAVLGLDLAKAAEVVKEENERVAAIIGINPSARTTCVKPSGTTSLVVGSSSGIHAWHSNYYIRNIRLGKNEALYKYLAENHPQLVTDEFFKPEQQAVVGIPVVAPKGALLRTESALELLARVKLFSANWIKPGHRKGDNTHNVSATISVGPDEWETVGQWMWDNRAVYNGLSVLPRNDHSYVQAPFTECSQEEYETLYAKLETVDLTKVLEESDSTDLKGEAACAGGGCEI